ncbi:MAG: hypothetical protein QM564_02450 [Bergeyella sp.]
MINKKDYFLVSNGILIIVITFLIVTLLLFLLKANDKSIIELTVEYYFKKNSSKI